MKIYSLRWVLLFVFALIVVLSLWYQNRAHLPIKIDDSPQCPTIRNADGSITVSERCRYGK